MNLKKYFGPGTLVAAAFIGPGTVTLCTLAGASAGTALLWALFFAVGTAVVLHEMTTRLGLITQNGLGEAIRQNTPPGIIRVAMSILVFSAIVIGNAAYEAGNISGAALGIYSIFPETKLWPVLIGLTAFALLMVGKYKLIERVLITLVLIMSLCFLLTLFVVKPDFGSIVQGLIPRKIDSGMLLMVIGLIGTTVVPYNLFLHASTIKKKWKSRDQLSTARKETAIAIVLGGFVSMCILILAGSTIYGSGLEVRSAGDMAVQLEPLLGKSAGYLFAIGLFAAGITSAITAPVAASFAAAGLFGWEASFKDRKFLAVSSIIIVTGIGFSTSGIKPIAIIQFAQIANGILLPVIIVFLLYIMNRKSVLGHFVNNGLQNILGIVVLFITLLLSWKTLSSIFGV